MSHTHLNNKMQSNRDQRNDGIFSNKYKKSTKIKGPLVISMKISPSTKIGTS